MGLSLMAMCGVAALACGVADWGLERLRWGGGLGESAVSSTWVVWGRGVIGGILETADV